MELKEAIDGLRTALQTELNGYQFYKLAAENTTDKKGKQVFETLANDEKEHFLEIQRDYEEYWSEQHFAPLF